MKLIFVILSFVLLSSSSIVKKEDQANHENEIPHHLVNLVQRCANNCKAKTHVTPEEVACLKENKIPESKTALCFLQCIMEKLGFIVKNKFLKNALVSTFAPIVKNNPEKKALLRQVSEECAEDSKNWEIHECGDMAYNVLKCFEKHKDEFNFSVPLSQIKI